MFRLSETTKAIIDRNTGVTVSELVSADDVDQIIAVESKIGAPLFFVEGNHPAAGKKYKTIEEVHSRIDAIIKEQ